MLRKSIVPIVGVLLVAGCGSSSSSPPGPEATVRSFADAYAKGDVRAACSYYDAEKPQSAVFNALLEAAQHDSSALGELERTTGSAKGHDDLCRLELGLLRKWDPDPKLVTALTVKDVDEGKERATVETSLGTWQLHEVDGGWKLSDVDPVIPAKLDTDLGSFNG